MIRHRSLYSLLCRTDFVAAADSGASVESLFCHCEGKSECLPTRHRINVFAACTIERKRGTPRLLFEPRCKPKKCNDSSIYVEIYVEHLLTTGGCIIL